VEVIQNQHQGLGLSGVLQEGGDGVEQPEAGLLWWQGRWWLQVRQFASHFGDNFSDIGCP
jgi:hypothetical protein